MKIVAYVDIYPWTKPEDVFITTRPSSFEKPKDCKRYRIEFEVPDCEVDGKIEANVEQIAS